MNEVNMKTAVLFCSVLFFLAVICISFVAVVFLIFGALSSPEIVSKTRPVACSAHGTAIASSECK